MKKIKFVLLIIIFLILFTISSLAITIPKATSDFYVNDFANVMTTETKQLIMQKSVELQSKTGAQIVVATVNDMGGSAVEEYAITMARQYGIGEKQKNNGVLILLAISERKSRIEVGYSLEGALPDGKTGRIQDEYMTPYYAKNNFDEGLKNGYIAILNEVLKEYSITLDGTVSAQKGAANNGSIPVAFQIIIVVFIIVLLLVDWIFLGGTITRTLFLFFIFNRGGRGGGGFGGGSGGGGFSGGGGSFGGGGSSRGF